ncbi:MAG: class I SAM-dependent rRNA methyltransferase [Opitutaceae bacterium]|nr:class I SAM-dependent rRNA methyltransferase [Opitutaceae bacterium]
MVECRDRADRFLGSGIYNSKSQIIWRRFSRERVALDSAWLRAALERAVARRSQDEGGGLNPAFAVDIAGDAPKAGLETPPYINPSTAGLGESDDLPGLVVDQFADVLVVQIQSLAMEKRATLIGDLLAELLRPAEIIFRNDASIRRLEGLPLEVHTRSGADWAPRWQRIDGMEYWLDLQCGQKTGFYLDQRRQHPLVAKYCAGKRVLDAFCNQGPFALHAARAGAAEVLGLDSAEEAVAQARLNAERNNVKATFAVANVFDWFNDPVRASEPKWDVIILDPPPFAKSKSALVGALRGYKEINLRAMQRLNPGGVLATYTCSHHMQDAELRGVLADAAADAKRKVHVLEYCHQPPDHPVLITMPESEYLRGYVLRVE